MSILNRDSFLIHLSTSQYFYDRRFLTLMRGAFCDATVSETLHSGLSQALQLTGMGMVRPNIVVAAFADNWRDLPMEALQDYENTISLISEVKRGAIVLRDNGNVFATSSSWRLQSAPWMIMPTRAMSKIRHSTAGAILGECFGFLTFFCMRAADTLDSLANANSYMPANDAEGLVSTKDFEAKGIELKSISTPEKSGAGKESEASPSWPMQASGPLTDTTNVQRQLNLRKKVIDIWWLLNDGGLSLLVPYLLQSPDSVSFFAAHKLVGGAIEELLCLGGLATPVLTNAHLQLICLRSESWYFRQRMEWEKKATASQRWFSFCKSIGLGQRRI